jgi:hypothetical protein
VPRNGFEGRAGLSIASYSVPYRAYTNELPSIASIPVHRRPPDQELKPLCVRGIADSRYHVPRFADP